jgi:hypothetical protein
MAWDAIRAIAVFGQVFPSADVHATIDLARIRADDFAIELSGEMNGEFSLAGSGWACYDESGVVHGNRGICGEKRDFIRILKKNWKKKKKAIKYIFNNGVYWAISESLPGTPMYIIPFLSP